MQRGVWWLGLAALLVSTSGAAQTAGGPPLSLETSGWASPRQVGSPPPTTRPETQSISIAAGAIDIWQKPAAQPTGFRAGDFTIFPVVTAGAYHDTNVFATPAGRRSDTAFFFRPEVLIRSNWQQHVLEFQGFVENRQYIRFVSENQWNGAARVAGTSLIDKDTRLRGTADYIHAHEDRGIAESGLFALDEPIAYDRYRLAGAIDKRFGSWWASVGANSVWINYEDPTFLGLTIPQTYRDGNLPSVSARVGRVIAPLTSLFVESVVNWRNFRVNDFDSRGYKVVGGVLFEPGRGARVRGEAYAGYMSQDYTGISFINVSTYTFGGSLSFLVTPQLTFTLAGSRDAAETALGCVVVISVIGCGHSVIESVVGIRADYLLLSSLIVSAGVSYVEDQFLGLPRTDRYWRPLASLRYAINPFVTLGLDYRYLRYDIDSTPAAAGTSRDVYMVSLNGRM